VVEELRAADAVAEAVVDSDGNCGGAVDEPGQLNHQRRGALQHICHVERQQRPPVRNCFRRLFKVVGVVTGSEGFYEHRSLARTHHLQALAFGPGPDPASEWVVGNQGPG